MHASPKRGKKGKKKNPILQAKKKGKRPNSYSQAKPRGGGKEKRKDKL